MLSTLNIAYCKPISTPIRVSIQPEKYELRRSKEEPDLMREIMYACAVGGILWLWAGLWEIQIENAKRKWNGF